MKLDQDGMLLGKVTLAGDEAVQQQVTKKQ